MMPCTTIKQQSSGVLLMLSFGGQAGPAVLELQQVSAADVWRRERVKGSSMQL